MWNASEGIDFIGTVPIVLSNARHCPQIGQLACSVDFVSVLALFLWLDGPQWARASSLSRLHDHTQLDTPHPVGLSWTSDRPGAETSTWQRTTLTRDRHPCHRRDSNLQSQQCCWDRSVLRLWPIKFFVTGLIINCTGARAIAKAISCET
jgi:hypothetical protein